MTYGQQMREASQIDETGKDADWIKRFGRAAMISKIERWHQRATAFDAMPQVAKRRLIARMGNSDDHSTGVCSVDDHA